jgi:hypothetical protein
LIEKPPVTVRLLPSDRFSLPGQASWGITPEGVRQQQSIVLATLQKELEKRRAKL